MQAPFGGELKRWLEIIDSSAMEMKEDNESAWEAVKVMLARKRRRARALTGREENVRLLSGFVARTLPSMQAVSEASLLLYLRDLRNFS